MKKAEKKNDIEEKEMKKSVEETVEAASKEELKVEGAEEQASDEASEIDELAKAQAEIQSLRDQYLRKVAEFENYRKRTSQEKVELIRNGGENVIKEMLPVLDDFDRAWENIDKTENLETLKEGVSLIIKKLRDTLAAQGLKAIETKDQDFNTDFHEAIALVPVDEDAKKGKVIDCVSTGYMLNDKVIRYAKVAVGQ